MTTHPAKPLRAALCVSLLADTFVEFSNKMDTDLVPADRHDDLLADDKPRWKPEDFPNHEPIPFGLSRAQRSPRCPVSR